MCGAHKRAPFLNAFLLGFVTELQNETRDQLAEMCSNESSKFLDGIASRQKPVVGVIGDQSSDISIQVRKSFCPGNKLRLVRRRRRQQQQHHAASN